MGAAVYFTFGCKLPTTDCFYLKVPACSTNRPDTFSWLVRLDILSQKVFHTTAITVQNQNKNVLFLTQYKATTKQIADILVMQNFGKKDIFLTICLKQAIAFSPGFSEN